MKITQKNLNEIYIACGVGSLDGVAPEEIVKVMNLRKAMRPHFEAYKAFEKDVREAQPNYDRLVEIEGKAEKSEEDKQFYADNIEAFVVGFNMAILPELNKEVELEAEGLSPETIAVLASKTKVPLAVWEVVEKAK